MKSALVLFAHGARDDSWAAPFRTIRDTLSLSRPDLTVRLAFLELMKPPLGQCIAELAATDHRRITVAPLFIGMGGHLRRDLPQLLTTIRDQHPALEIVALPPIGEVQPVLDAISQWLVNGVQR
jgi:sirohydrochlorin cobaltochelatase